MLELAAWGVADPNSLPWLDPPPAAPFAQAQDLLKRLEAIDADGSITAMGKQMVRLPLHPRLAHMVVKGRSTLAADLAAMLSERDGLPRDVGADITARLAQHSAVAARDRIRQSAKQIRQIAGIEEDGQRRERRRARRLRLSGPHRPAPRRRPALPPVGRRRRRSCRSMMR